ncbi:MAG: DUF4097 family beta strand repeat-containing protein [Lachnospiraceae bacterium]|nr:DUF4097 family beta strand repeat-containing protein [Lachnospiraceae bacterium]
MSRQEYMNKLIDALSAFDEDIREEIINDYEDHFVNGLKSGKSEEEIAKELGSIDELVSDLNALSGKNDAEDTAETTGSEDASEEGAEAGADAKKSTFSEDASEKINEVIQSFATLIGEFAAGINKGSKKVTSTVGEGVKKASSTVGEGAKKVTETLGDGAKKVSEKVGSGAKDLSEGAKEFANNFASSFMKGYESIAQSVGNMADKVKSSDFAKGISEGYKRSMNRSAEGENAETEENDAGKTDETEGLADFDLDDVIDISNRSIDPDELDPGDIDDYFPEDEVDEDEFDEEEDGEFYSFSEDVENLVIEAEGAEVYLDQSEDNNLNINYENDGNPNQKLVYRFECKQKGKTLYASVKKQPGLSNFFQTLSCPDISLYFGLNDSVKKISVRTMSGDVNANEIEVEQLKINSMSGDIDIEDCSVKVAELQTMSGDIDVTVDEATSFTMSSISGDINLEGYCESIHAKTTSGDLDFTIDNEGCDITASSVSGDIDIELSNDAGYIANVKSTAGSIDLNCGDEEKEITRSGNYIMGEGGARLTLSSISGDISVNA